MKNKLKDNIADVKQYKHNSPENSVFKMYKKYALATAIEVVIPIKITSPSDFSESNVVFLVPNCKPMFATKPYASMPNSGRGTPDNRNRKIINFPNERIAWQNDSSSEHC